MFHGAKGILFTPMLQQEDVVDHTGTAMLRGRPLVVMPWTSKMNKVLSAVLPVQARRYSAVLGVEPHHVLGDCTTRGRRRHRPYCFDAKCFTIWQRLTTAALNL